MCIKNFTPPGMTNDVTTNDEPKRRIELAYVKALDAGERPTSAVDSPLSEWG